MSVAKNASSKGGYMKHWLDFKVKVEQTQNTDASTKKWGVNTHTCEYLTGPGSVPLVNLMLG